MVAIQIMLCVFGVIIAVAVISALFVQRWERWLIARGARDAQWLALGDDPPGFKQLRAELREKTQQR